MPNDAAAGANSGNGAAGDPNANAGGGAPGGNAGAGDGGAPAAGASGAPAAGAAQPGAGQNELYGAPEAYGEWKPAEQFDPGFKTELQQLGKDLNLSEKGIAKLYKVAEQRAVTMEKTFKDAHQANLSEWQSKSSTDAEFGGAKYDENRAVAVKGIEHFGTPALREILKESGLENHPEFLRMFYRVGKAVSEDRFVRGGASQNSENSGLFTYDKSNHAT